MLFCYDKTRLKKLLEPIKIKQNFDLNLILAEKLRASYVFNTAWLEWNPMTYPEVQTLLEWITIGWHKLSDEKQILNQNKSWKLLLKLVKNNEFQLNKETVLKLHKEVAKEEALTWWEFRNANVKIWWTEHKPPNFEKLDEIFDKWFSQIEKIENILLKALLSFLFLANSQFFFDWNKRTGRLVMNWILLQNWLPFLNILARDRLEFNEKMIWFFDSQDTNEILEFLIEYYKKSSLE